MNMEDGRTIHLILFLPVGIKNSFSEEIPILYKKETFPPTLSLELDQYIHVKSGKSTNE